MEAVVADDVAQPADRFPGAEEQAGRRAGSAVPPVNIDIDIDVELDLAVGLAVVPVGVRLFGELDTATVAVVRELLDRFRNLGHQWITVDVTGLRFLGPAGAGEFVRAGEALRAAGGRLVLSGLTPPMRRLLDITGQTDMWTEPGASIGGSSCGTLAWTRAGWEHALVVARGEIDDAVLADFDDRIAVLVASGVRYVVADLSQVSSCSGGLVPAMAAACRVLQRQHGWLRSVATASSVTAILDEAEVGDLFAVYQAIAAAGTGEAP
jgi:anti-sigma B factor antagonist